MKTIGIIGASGQVGTEVCLFLKTYSQIRVIAIVRSSISAALLKRLGIEYRLGSPGDENQCRELLKDMDMVVDFSVLVGEVRDTKGYYQNNIARAVKYSAPGTRYVFISSINAFGMSEQFNKAKSYLIPHSIYAATKRFGEHLAMSSGRKHGKETFIFRLGHVHGLLQRVSAETIKLVNGKYRHFEYPDTPSYTIFCYSIAEGLVNVAEGKEKPGLYVLVSNPAWSWKEVLEYYLEEGREINVRLTPQGSKFTFGKLSGGMKRSAFNILSKYKDTLRANILHYMPDVENRNKANLYIQRVKSQIGEHEAQFTHKPEGIHEGVFPGKRIGSLSDSRTSMAAKTKEVTKMLETLLPENGAVAGFSNTVSPAMLSN